LQPFELSGIILFTEEIFEKRHFDRSDSTICHIIEIFAFSVFSLFRYSDNQFSAE